MPTQASADSTRKKGLDSQMSGFITVNNGLASFRSSEQ